MFKIENERLSFWQWDTNQRLIVEDASITEVHFCNRTGDCSLVCEVYEENGKRLVDVPNILLQDNWTIRVYAYCANYTKIEEKFIVFTRSKPADYVYTETEIKNYEDLAERISQIEENGISDEAVNSAIERYLEENGIEVDVDLTGYATEEYVDKAIGDIDIPEVDLTGYAKKTDIPSLSGYATEKYVNDAVAKAQLSGGNVDLSDYATKEYVDNKIDNIPGSGGSANEVVLKSPDGTQWRIVVSDSGVITATKVSGDDSGEEGGEGEEIIVFTPFKFIQLSDTHYQYSQDATALTVANINALSDVDFVTIAGDISLDQTKDDEIKRAELAEYKANFKDLLNVPLYACVGGHDLCKSTESIWAEYTGMERLHEVVHKDCVFLFADVLLAGYLDWLEEKVAKHTGKRIFIYEHHPIENDEFTVGLKDGETRCTWGNTEMQRILRLLRNNHNVVWFTGHTHWAFGIAVNDVYNEDGLMGTIVHTPYLNAKQGWEVNVNENATILKAVSFAESGMSYMGGSYDYTIEQDITDYGETEIITEGGTVTVGGETNISIYLAAAPKSNQVVNVKTDDFIGASVTSLTFTPSNYNAPQIVKVTGKSAGTGRLVLYSNSKTTVRKIDVVAGSVTINHFNKNKPLTTLGSYYGAGSSASYQLSNLIPAKTGDHVRSNALGSQTTYRLKMFDANFNYIAEACNNAQSIDYTITEANVEYVSVVYRGATAGQADTIMVTVNQELPSEYIAYNGEPVGYVLTNYADANNPSLANGYYNSAFVEQSASGISVSNLIPCVVGDSIYSNNGTSSNFYLYMYDEAQAMIERASYSNSITNENAAYFAVAYDNTKANLMIMKNQKIPGYYVADTDTM